MQCQPFNDCRFLSFFPLLQRTFSRRTNEIKCENDKQTQREEMSVPTIAPNLLMLRSQCRKKRLLSAAKRRRSAPIQRSPLGRWHSSRKGLRSADDNAAECNVCTFKLACSKHKMIWMNDERTHELSVTEDHRRVSRVCCVCVCRARRVLTRKCCNEMLTDSDFDWWYALHEHDITTLNISTGTRSQTII